MTTPETIRTRIIDLVKENHKAKFTPKFFDSDEDKFTKKATLA
jgi:hypothetical protein